MKRKFVDSDIDPVKYFFPSIGEIIDSYLEKKGKFAVNDQTIIKGGYMESNNTEENSPYTACYNHDKGLITIKFNHEAMVGYMKTEFYKRALERIKNSVDECFHKGVIWNDI